MGKRPAHIIVFAAARLDEPLEFGNDAVPASLTGIVYAEAVVNLAATVEAEDDVAHLTVSKLYNVVVDENAVCRERESEIFARFLFDGARIGNEPFYDVEVHQRLAAEEIDLEIPA